MVLFRDSLMMAMIVALPSSSVMAASEINCRITKDNTQAASKELVLAKSKSAIEPGNAVFMTLASDDYVGFVYLPPIDQIFLYLVRVGTNETAKAEAQGLRDAGMSVAATLGKLSIGNTAKAKFPMFEDNSVRLTCDLK